MIRMSIKIFHCLILLITGIALIGVNVRLLHCCHSKDSVVEVRIMPDEEEQPCCEDCCGTKQCHTHSHHTFYKVTDFSRVESGFHTLHIACILLYVMECSPLKSDFQNQSVEPDGMKALYDPPSCSFLCTYRC